MVQKSGKGIMALEEETHVVNHEAIVGDSTFHILQHNQAQVYISLGSVNNVHIWWCMSIPLVRTVWKALGCFCHQKHRTRVPKHNDKCAMMRKRIMERRQNWLLTTKQKHRLIATTEERKEV